jgi:hypothetical protein
MIVPGRQPRAAWKLLARIKKRYRKEKEQFITLREFSAFTGIDEESIFATIN